MRFAYIYEYIYNTTYISLMERNSELQLLQSILVSLFTSLSLAKVTRRTSISMDRKSSISSVSNWDCVEDCAFAFARVSVSCN